MTHIGERHCLSDNFIVESNVLAAAAI